MEGYKDTDSAKANMKIRMNSKYGMAVGKLAEDEEFVLEISCKRVDDDTVLVEYHDDIHCSSGFIRKMTFELLKNLYSLNKEKSVLLGIADFAESLDD